MVGDPGNTKSRDARLHKTLYVYWLFKMIMGKVLVKRGHAYSEILLQQDHMKEDLNKPSM